MTKLMHRYIRIKQKNADMESKLKMHALRLKPGEDLKIALQQFVLSENIRAGWIISCVGSLHQFHLRFANQEKGSSGNGFFEIIALSGTLSVNGSHLHIGVANDKGNMIGGHLLDGCLVRTTAEIIIGESPELIFTREKDGTTAWNELQIKIRPSS
jgi:predicted DNA-binding protein with PD1-like motif